MTEIADSEANLLFNLEISRVISKAWLVILKYAPNIYDQKRAEFKTEYYEPLSLEV